MPPGVPPEDRDRLPVLAASSRRGAEDRIEVSCSRDRDPGSANSFLIRPASRTSHQPLADPDQAGQEEGEDGGEQQSGQRVPFPGGRSRISSGGAGERIIEPGRGMPT